MNASADGPSGALDVGFGLDADGESLALFDPDTNIVDFLAFGLQAPGFTVDAWDRRALDTVLFRTPESVNEAAPAPPSAMVLNEFLANSDAGDDWIELHNTAGLPAQLTGCYLTTSNALFQVRAPVFIAPGGFVILKADEQPGPNHVNFRLPAAGGPIPLADSAGLPLGQVTYGPQPPRGSMGGLPGRNRGVGCTPLQRDTRHQQLPGGARGHGSHQ